MASFAEEYDAAQKSAQPPSFAEEYDKANPQPGDTVTGFKRAFAQVPELAYGAGALTAMSAEHLFGGGGLSTAAKDYFIGKYSETKAGNEKYAPTVEFTDAWSKLKSGDIGSMADWLQDSAGYVVGQGLQTIATAGVGAIAGKAALSVATQKMLSGVVAKQAAKIAEEQAVKKGLTEAAKDAAIVGMMPEATKLAAKRIAEAVGAGVALGGQNLGMEAGDIFGGLTEQAEKTGKAITGEDLLRAWGAAAAAAGTEVATDLLGVGAMTGRIKIGGKAMQSMTGAGGRAARGATAAAVGFPIESGQEYLQTWLEQYGAGKPTDTPEAQKERINAAAVGGLGGTIVGGGAGLLSSPKPVREEPKPAEQPKALTDQGPDAMVVFPDGTTMTAAEARERGLNKQVMPKTEPAPVEVAYTVMSTKSVDGAIAAAETAALGIPSVEYNEGTAQAGLINARYEGDRQAELRQQGVEPAPGTQIPAVDGVPTPPLPELADGPRTQEQSLWMAKATADEKRAVDAGKEADYSKIISESRLPAAEYDLAMAEKSGAQAAGAAPTAMELAMQKAQAKKNTGLINAEPLSATAGTRAEPVKVETAAHVEHAAAKVNTEPTEAQKESGNYSKAHIKLQGLDISIENPEGSVRSGKDGDGNTWETVMPAAYGYIKRSNGADGDQVDVYIGPEPLAPEVFVVDQIDQKTGDFDEHKGLIGFTNQQAAESAYRKGFSDGKGQERMGAVTAMPIEEFKVWAKSGDTTKPLAYSGRAEPTEPSTDPLKPLIESLIKRRAAAGQVGIERSINTAVERAKKAMAGGDVKPSYFGTLAKSIKGKDAETAGILDKIADQLKNPQPAAEQKPEGFSPAEVARREKLKQKARARKVIDMASDSLITAIAKLGGISMDHRKDVTGEEKGNRSIAFVGHLFSSNGRGLDDMATSLAQYGYLTEEEMDSVDGGVQALRDKIRGEYDGVQSHYSSAGEEDRLSNARDEEGLAAEEQEQVVEFVEESIDENAEFAVDSNWSTMSEDEQDAEIHAALDREISEAVAQSEAGGTQSSAPSAESGIESEARVDGQSDSVSTEAADVAKVGIRESGAPSAGAAEERTDAPPAGQPAANAKTVTDTAPAKAGVSTSEPDSVLSESPSTAPDETEIQRREEKAIADRERDQFALTPQATPEKEAGSTAQADIFGGPKPEDLQKPKGEAPEPGGLFAQSPESAGLTASQIPADMTITLEVEVEETGRVEEVELNARDAFKEAKRKVNRLQALRECLTK